METYQAANGLVNGDIINDLLLICNNWFANPWYQLFAGANAECMFCGCIQNSQGGGDHSAADCPVIHLQDVAEKYPKYLVKK